MARSSTHYVHNVYIHVQYTCLHTQFLHTLIIIELGTELRYTHNTYIRTCTHTCNNGHNYIIHILVAFLTAVQN